MTQDDGKKPQDEQVVQGEQHSIIRFLESKTGEAPRVSLRDEESASVSAPVIDPNSKEKLSIPGGRGNYQLLGEIARGGMGVVMKAHDGDLGRDVAFKVLDKRLCERIDVVQRFVEEAQIGGQLQHPGIVPVYDLGMMADERPYFTMKLVKGRTLAALLAERESPSSDLGHLIDVFESICQTMGYAHSRGVIHRDLKPANIMVGAFGEVQVVDWGLAKVLLRGGNADEKRARDNRAEQTILETVRSDGSSTGTESMFGSVMGTPSYMPPEQARGLVDRLDERSDVFALGAILCEILTGFPPYHGERDETVSAAAQAELDDAYARLDASGADAALVKLAHQCLTAAPAARPANAGVLAERVHTYVVSVRERAQQAEVEAAEAGVRVQAERRARKLTLALGVAVVAVVLVGGGGFLWVQGDRAAQREAIAMRDRELGADVNAALKTAATLQGAERWDEAVLAAERAQALAEGGGASPELLAQVGAVLTELRVSMDAEQQRAQQRLDTQRLLAELHQIVQPNEMEQDADKAAAYQMTMLAHGIDLDAGSLAAAAESLTKRGLGSDAALTLDAWAEARRLNGDEAGAVRLLELAHLVDRDPERADLREALAVRDLDYLRVLADSGLEGQPASTIALLATSLDRLGDRAAALAVYRAGVERYADDFGVLYRLGTLLTPDHDSSAPDDEMREAVECFRAVLALQPQNAWARFYLGRLYNKLDDRERSREQYQIAVDLEPDDGEFRFRLAGVQRNLELIDEARANLERTATMDEPSWLQGWSNSALGTMAFRRGELDRSLELARLAWGSNASRGWGPRVWMLTSFFWITRATGDKAPLLEARTYFMEMFGLSSETHNRLAWLLFQMVENPGRFDWDIGEASPAGETALMELASELALRAVELEPKNALIWNTLGVVRHFAGDHTGAIEALLRELELEAPPDASTYFTLAMSEHALGNSAAASKWYTRGISWMAANPDGDEATQWFRIEAQRVLGEE